MNIAIRHQLVDLLNDAVQHTVFSRRDGGGIGADRYRLMWSDPDSVERLSGYTMKEPLGFDELVKTVASALGPFVGEDQEGNPVVYSNIELIVAQAGSDETPLDHYCRMLLLAAVRTSPERVVDLLGLWLDGEPIPRTHVIVLGGLTMEVSFPFRRTSRSAKYRTSGVSPRISRL